MGARSLVSLVNWKRRVKYSLFLIAVVLVFGILTTNNPQKTKASLFITPVSCTFYPQVPPAWIPDPTATHNCENKDVIINGGTVLTKGTHHFKSLTIRYNDGVLQHEALERPLTRDYGLTPSGPGYFHERFSSDDYIGTIHWDTNFNIISTNYVITNEGEDKKVDLVIDGELRMESGGKIDVSGKGYPGGTPRSGACQTAKTDPYEAYKDINICPGMGPGGSPGIISQGPTIGAGGAGYGGNGGYGYSSNSGKPYYGYAKPGMSYGNSEISEFHFGSGGGTSCRGGIAWPGLAGGGRVKIEAKSIISDNSDSGIFANGFNSNGIEEGGDHYGSLQGPGSGGSIILAIKSPTPTNFYTNVAGNDNICSYNNIIHWAVCNVPPCCTSGDNGSMNLRGFNSNTVQRINLQANGGQNDYWGHELVNLRYGSGGGGGGRIMIEQASAGGIKKILESVERGGDPTNTVFNPYALQIGDIIKVTITAPSINAGDTVRDNFLSSGTKMCKFYSTASPSIPPPTFTNTSIEWVAQAGNREFSYYCLVQ